MRFKPENFENYKLARRYFLSCCHDMKNLLATYSPSPSKGDAIPFTCDAFSVSETKQLDRFWTPAENAFLQDWQGFIIWAHPPYSLAGQVLNKIKETPHFTGCVFLPEWRTEDWFLEFVEVCTTLRTFTTVDGMFTLHGKYPQPRPNWNCTAFYFIDSQLDQTALNFVNRGHFGEPEAEVISHSITATLKATPLFINTVSLQIGDTEVKLRALWDGGATDSIIHSSKARKYFAKHITPAMVTLVGYSEVEETDEPQFAEGQILPTVHVFSESETISIQHTFLLARVSSLYDILIGRDLMVRLRAVEDYERRTISVHLPDNKTVTITPDIKLSCANSVTIESQERAVNSIQFEGIDVDVGILPTSEHDKFLKLMTEYSDVFSLPNDTMKLPPPSEFEHRIILKDPAKIHYAPPIPLPKPHRDWLQGIYDSRVASGCASIAMNCPYASRAFVIPKKAPGQYREVIDYRGLNSNTVKDKFPLPRIDNLFDETLHSDIKSILDMVDGYYNYRMHKDSAAYTAVIAPFGQFVNNVMPQGLCNAPPFFQMANTTRFSDLIHTRKELLLYLDDLLCHTKTISEHFQALERLFSLCRKYHLRLKLVKCAFFQKEVSWLGHVLGQDTLKPDPKLISSILEYPVPNSLKTLRGFLGLAGYYRRFIPRFATVATPLTDLLLKEAPALPAGWGEAQARAFLAIKGLLSHEPVLRLYSFGLLTEVHTDASTDGIGGVLLQKFEEEWHPIAFFSARMNPAQRRYTTTEQEMLAIITALQRWRVYLIGIHFKIRTDHKACTYIQSKSNGKLSLREQRWLDLLADFDCEIDYLQGSLNVVPDALSRAHMHLTLSNDIPAATLSPQEATLSTNAATPSKDLPGLLNGSGSDSEDELTGLLDLNSDSDPGTDDSQCYFCSLYKAEQIHPSTRILECYITPSYTELISHISALTQKRKTTAQTSSLDNTQQDNSYSTVISPRTCMDEYLQRMTLHPEYKKFLENPPQHYFVHNGYLYYQTDHVARALYIPADNELRQHIVRICHDHPFAGHMGRDRTLTLVRRYFYWPGLASYVAEYVKRCPICQLANPGNVRPAAPLIPIPPAGAPFREVTIDFLKVAESKTGFNYLLVIVCRFSKFGVFIKTVDTVTGTEAGKLFSQFFVRYFGVPRRILSDRGPNLAHGYWPDFMKALGAHSSYTTAYHPQTNGQTERMNRTLLQMLRKYCSDYPELWDEYLDALFLAYNNSSDTPDGYSPYYIVFGRHPDLPLFLQEPDPPKTVDSHLADLYTTFRKVYRTISDKLHLAAQRMKQQADNYRRSQTFVPGDMVKLRTGLLDSRDKHKLDNYWSGPYKLLKVNDHNNTVELELPSGSTVHPVFNFDKIEPFHISDTDKFPLDKPQYTPQQYDTDKYGFDIVYFRDWSIKTVRYFVRWTGYAHSPGDPNSHGWAYETPDTVDMWITLEQSYGIFPEKGITQKNRSRVRSHKLRIYGHVFPILVSTPTVSTTTVRSRSTRPPSKPQSPTQLLSKVVEDARDVGDEAVYMAGQVLSYNSSSAQFTIKWTDGSTSSLSMSQVLEILLPNTPVSVMDDPSST